MTKSYVTSIIILFCTVLIETAILSNISILPSIPDLMLISVLYFSTINGCIAGEITGFASGLFLDFLSGSPFGFNCLYRTLIGYLSGLLGKSFNFEGFLMPAILGGIATLLKAFLVFLIALFYPSVHASYRIFSVSFIFELLCNVFLTPLMFKFFSLFKSSIEFPQEKIK
jgi:rod shape-determining protein MreD